MRLQLMGYTNFTPLVRSEEAIVEQMKEIGIEMYIQNEDFSVLFGGWSDRAPNKIGDFDIQFNDWGFEGDPQNVVFRMYHSSQIPSADNPEGYDIFRWRNEKADEAIETAGSNLDIETRKTAYCTLAEEINRDVVDVFFYLFLNGNGYNKKVHGYTIGIYGSLSWDAENWWIEQ